jgi:hypothetical protein
MPLSSPELLQQDKFQDLILTFLRRLTGRQHRLWSRSPLVLSEAMLARLRTTLVDMLLGNDIQNSVLSTRNNALLPDFVESAQKQLRLPTFSSPWLLQAVAEESGEDSVSTVSRQRVEAFCRELLGESGWADELKAWKQVNQLLFRMLSRQHLHGNALTPQVDAYLTADVLRKLVLNLVSKQPVLYRPIQSHRDVVTLYAAAVAEQILFYAEKRATGCLYLEEMQKIGLAEELYSIENCKISDKNPVNRTGLFSLPSFYLLLESFLEVLPAFEYSGTIQKKHLHQYKGGYPWCKDAFEIEETAIERIYERGGLRFLSDSLPKRGLNLCRFLRFRLAEEDQLSPAGARFWMRCLSDQDGRVAEGDIHALLEDKSYEEVQHKIQVLKDILNVKGHLVLTLSSFQSLTPTHHPFFDIIINPGKSDAITYGCVEERLFRRWVRESVGPHPKIDPWTIYVLYRFTNDDGTWASKMVDFDSLQVFRDRRLATLVQGLKIETINNEFLLPVHKDSPSTFDAFLELRD